LQKLGQARLRTGYDERGFKTIAISFFDFNDAPLDVRQTEAVPMVEETPIMR
jgi:hypothetical protein